MRLLAFLHCASLVVNMRPRSPRPRKPLSSQLQLPGIDRETATATPPVSLAAYGLQVCHPWPDSAMDKTTLHQHRARPYAEAYRDCQYVELDPPTVYATVKLDVDEPSMWQFLPDPNIAVIRTDGSYRQHVIYTLADPVAKHRGARSGPQDFLRDIVTDLTLYAGADIRFNGGMVHNPLNPGPDYETVWNRPEPWTLAELRDAFPRGRRKKRPGLPDEAYVGRNCELFGWAVKVAHRPEWGAAIAAYGDAGCPSWLNRVRQENVELWGAVAAVLPDSECRSIAKSTARYSLRQYAPEIFAERQYARAVLRWGPTVAARLARNMKIRELALEGMTQRAIAAACSAAGWPISYGQVDAILDGMAGRVREARRAARDVRIMELASLGLSQREIAATLTATGHQVSQSGVFKVLRAASGDYFARMP